MRHSKWLLIVVCMSLSCLENLSAQEKVSKDAAEVFALMPDSMCPYLNMQQRVGLIRYAQSGINDTINNILEGKSYVTYYSADGERFDIQLTSNLHWSISTDGMTHTITAELCAPRCARTTYTYRAADWQLLKVKREPVELETEEEQTVYL